MDPRAPGLRLLRPKSVRRAAKCVCGVLVLGFLPFTGCREPNPVFVRGSGMTDGGAKPDQAVLRDVIPDNGSKPIDPDPIDVNSPTDTAAPGDSADESGTSADTGAAGPMDALADQNSVPDLAPPPDLPATPDTPPPDVPSTPACAGIRADVLQITNADGVSIASDGTIYYSSTNGTDGLIGRLRPGMKLEPAWARFRNQPTTWGLALDEARRKLYYLSDEASGVFVINLDVEPPDPQVLVSDIPHPNEIIVRHRDGTVFVSSHGTRHVHRVGGGGGRVTTTPVGDNTKQQFPAGLAFGPDGYLYIGLQTSGRIHRIKLNESDTEIERDTSFSTWSGWANGMAFDQKGRLYVGVYSNTQEVNVTRIEANGTNPRPVAIGRFASVAFGRGPLSACDLYIGNPYGPMQIVSTDTPGMTLP
jgi:hypothetical protein